MPRSRRSVPHRRETPRAPTRRRYSSGTAWESVVPYSRAIRVGSRVYVSGTTSTGPDGTVVAGSAYAQTRRALDNIERALAALGSRREAIVRLHLYLTDLADFEGVARALRERFGAVRPTSTLVEVSRLIDPALRVEVEADADDEGLTEPERRPRRPPAARRSRRAARAPRRPS